MAHNCGCCSTCTASLNPADIKAMSTPKPAVRSTILVPLPAILALYLAVCSLEHCSIEICGGYTIPSIAAHEGIFVRAFCRPAI